jgi:hypothetical protein
MQKVSQMVQAAGLDKQAGSAIMQILEMPPDVQVSEGREYR